MANLAIKGHSTRGSEVIALLEMLGGENDKVAVGNNKETYYFVDKESKIRHDFTLDENNNYTIFTLEEFEEKFPYKVGDKVWLHYENSTIRVTETITCMRWCNKWNYVLYDVYTCGNLRESAFTPYKEETMETAKITITPQRHWNKDKIELDVAKDYKIKEENGKYYIVRKQFKYPKTYKECCDVLGLNTMDNDAQGHKADLIIRFQELLIARDAFWKIAGEQMGLGKPWEPDYNEVSYEQGSPIKHVIHYTGTHITKGCKCTPSYILMFPTADMCNAFYENFKELIEGCKELL